MACTAYLHVLTSKYYTRQMSSSTEVTLAAMRREMRPLLETAMECVLTKARSVLEEAEQRRAQGLAEVAEERAKGLAELDTERAAALAEADARRADLQREIATMHLHKETQEGRVELNIGGYRFETSVQTLRRLPHTFFDAYFSGRYAQDVCTDGSIFVDRDGEHFGHVLEYMRDGVVSVAEPGANVSVSLLRVLKREFGFYCIELSAEPELEQPEIAFVMGGISSHDTSMLSSMDQYDAMSGQWSTVASMGTARYDFGVCTIAGELYITGGRDALAGEELRSVEKYTPSTDTWSAVTSMPVACSRNSAVAVGSVLYVLGAYDAPDTVLRFDTIVGTWSEVAPLPESRFGVATCVVESDIYVFGGFPPVEAMSQSVFKYDTLTNTWSTLAPMPHACSRSAAYMNGLVYIPGAGVNRRENLCFDPASGGWKTLAPLPTRRNQCSAFVLSGYLYAVGGQKSESSVERYDVDNDTWTAMADLTHGRIGFGAISIGSAGPAEEQDLFDSLIAEASLRCS
jgi:hypothetical protein